MFNMKTSDLFKRAKQLADLEGSDFISWNEAVNNINESNVALYEKLINMGDNSFVKSFHMEDKSIELPSDFWQLKGVFLWNNGNLQTINRRADNNGIHHLSYELRNGKIEVFGNPNDVLVEYFPKPKKLYFKPHDVAISLDTTKEYLDCYKHTFLYEDTDDQNNETLSIIDLDGVKTVKDFMQITHNSVLESYLTDNYVFIMTNSGMTLYDIMSGEFADVSNYAPLITESGNTYLISRLYESNGSINSFYIENGNIITNKIKDTELLSNAAYCVCNDDFTDLYYRKYGSTYHNENVVSDVWPNHMVYSDGKCYYLLNSGFFVIENDEVKIIENSVGRIVGFIGIDERTGYGYCTKKFGSYYVCGYCEDTPLNYPNSMYFQIIAYILAIAFKAKQGADVTLLSSQLQMAEQTFEDTLGSDAFQYPRMGNVYR